MLGKITLKTGSFHAGKIPGNIAKVKKKVNYQVNVNCLYKKNKLLRLICDSQILILAITILNHIPLTRVKICHRSIDVILNEDGPGDIYIMNILNQIISSRVTVGSSISVIMIEDDAGQYR